MESEPGSAIAFVRSPSAVPGCGEVHTEQTDVPKGGQTTCIPPVYRMINHDKLMIKPLKVNITKRLPPLPPSSYMYLPLKGVG